MPPQYRCRLEADTCRTLITPKLQAAGGRTTAFHAEQRTSQTDEYRSRQHGERRAANAPITSSANTRDFPIAVVEAKSERTGRHGFATSQGLRRNPELQICLRYNGKTSIEFDYITGL